MALPQESRSDGLQVSVELLLVALRQAAWHDVPHFIDGWICENAR